MLLLVVLLLGTAAAGATQVIAASGVRLLIPPLAILTCGHAEGLRIALVLGLLISVVTFFGERDKVPFRAYAALAIPVAIAAPLWVLLVGLLPDSLAARLAGLVALVGLVVTVLGVRTGRLVGRAGSIGAGVASSGLFALGGVGGPVLAMCARDNQWDDAQSKAIVNASVAVAQVMVLGFMGFPDVAKPGFAVGLFALAAGLVLGAATIKRVPALTAGLARNVSRGLAGVTAMALLVFGSAA